MLPNGETADQLHNLGVSWIRTTVPVVVGAAVAWLASVGMDVGAEAQVGLTTFLTALITAVYYFVVRRLEMSFPQVGWLLGIAKQPGYKALPPPAEPPGNPEPLG